MGHLYLHITTDQVNYQLIQTHQHKNHLQVHQHNLTPVQTYQKSSAPPSPYNRSGIYKLTCMTCNKAYVGHTSRNLRQRYKEHARYIKNNNPQSAKPVKNTSLLTPYQQFFIQAFHKSGRLVSEQNPGEPNPLLQMAINPSHPLTWPC